MLKEIRNQAEAEKLQNAGEKLVGIKKDPTTGTLVYEFDSVEVKAEVENTVRAPAKSRK